jgi:hypothetical protein
LVRRSSTLDWDRVVARSRKWRVTTPLFLALSLLRDHFNVDVPVVALESLVPHRELMRRRARARFAFPWNLNRAP